MSESNRQDTSRDGSRVAGYLICTLLGVPLVLLVASVIVGPALGVSAAVTAGAVGLVYALRAATESR